ncbi:uncharacterized protein ASCRUDRAFT_75624 [Ascoidea rubescens DSM 1968]|uniref:Uncharacterized protein n=1 Tax=Ascoidea rubescens DSM 1968 TaxID=1344418 RepID=A0A1D2VJ58_9ASCO|nr:hypothetical protein ASCRUDRAFT_75624 [Ascoidea rubescens DSM 1968]ODV61635.1 hypothetical protein ASCRUDRAFT_75624 [Ascoidea rubescens DSM 1968]
MLTITTTVLRDKLIVYDKCDNKMNQLKLYLVILLGLTYLFQMYLEYFYNFQFIQ